jgi:hypothetical protein
MTRREKARAVVMSLRDDTRYCTLCEEVTIHAGMVQGTLWRRNKCTECYVHVIDEWKIEDNGVTPYMKPVVTVRTHYQMRPGDDLTDKQLAAWRSLKKSLTVAEYRALVGDWSFDP